MRPIFFILLTAMLCFSLITCNDPSIIGSDLLQEDEIALKYVDSFSIRAQTIVDSGNVVYDPSLPIVLSRLPIGRFDDPVFGLSDAKIYVQFIKSSLAIRPDFNGATLDSVILFVAMDTVYTPYGNNSDLSSFEVYRMKSGIRRDFRYKSGTVFETDMNPIGSLTSVFADNKQRIDIIEPTDTFTYDPHISFKLDRAFGQSILDLDSLAYNSDSIFLARVPGFMLKQSVDNRRMVSFVINSAYSRLQIYYHQAGTAQAYFFPLQLGPRVPGWDYTPSPAVKAATNSTDKGSELLYLQSLSSLKAKIEFPTIKLPTGAIINKAELIATAIELPGDILTTYTPSTQLILLKKGASGNEILTSDQGSLQDFSLLGGALTKTEVNGLISYTYKMNISNHIQEIINGKEAPEVYIGVIPKNDNLSRVVIGGPKHPIYPLKLKISYSIL